MKHTTKLLITFFLLLPLLSKALTLKIRLSVDQDSLDIISEKAGVPKDNLVFSVYPEEYFTDADESVLEKRSWVGDKKKNYANCNAYVGSVTLNATEIKYNVIHMLHNKKISESGMDILHNPVYGIVSENPQIPVLQIPIAVMVKNSRGDLLRLIDFFVFYDWMTFRFTVSSLNKTLYSRDKSSVITSRISLKKVPSITSLHKAEHNLSGKELSLHVVYDSYSRFNETSEVVPGMYN